MDKLVEKCRKIINEQIIDWACKEGMTQELLAGIIREELIPIIQKAERADIACDLRAILKEATDLKVLERELVEYAETLKGETDDKPTD